ncbi:hypothetical protein SAMN04488239_106167 [Ruegeria marina]|uniref:Uncharacterized protein n=1 Tax=Ruegeria marina TaxID=639004 RepID=A0A1G6TTR1_9RHOB|nr:hypothetical protein SAMN04488239_106167 [Ruegeria marina]
MRFDPIMTVLNKQVLCGMQVHLPMPPYCCYGAVAPTYHMLCIYNAYAVNSTATDLEVSKKETKSHSKKDSQLVLRLGKKERDDFVEMCKSLDTSAAREIRRFIRTFMKEHEKGQ